MNKNKTIFSLLHYVTYTNGIINSENVSPKIKFYDKTTSFATK